MLRDSLPGGKQQGPRPGIVVVSAGCGDTRRTAQAHPTRPAGGGELPQPGNQSSRDFFPWPLEGTPPGERQVSALRFKRAWRRSQFSQDIPPIPSRQPLACAEARPAWDWQTG